LPRPSSSFAIAILYLRGCERLKIAGRPGMPWKYLAHDYLRIFMGYLVVALLKTGEVLT